MIDAGFTAPLNVQSGRVSVQFRILDSQFLYECRNCKTLLRSKPGDRCVFCSYGWVECPPIQERRGCCG